MVDCYKNEILIDCNLQTMQIEVMTAIYCGKLQLSIQVQLEIFVKKYYILFIVSKIKWDSNRLQQCKFTLFMAEIVLCVGNFYYISSKFQVVKSAVCWWRSENAIVICGPENIVRNCTWEQLWMLYWTSHVVHFI